MREQILEAQTPERRLEALEVLLAARLPQVRALHPAVAVALARFREDAEVRDVVADSGYSHRRFIALFREAVGLAPKLYCRVRRFQKAVAYISSNRHTSWGDVALSAGYSDQAHFNRDFLEFAGVTPGAYRRISPDLPNHVAVS